MTCGKRFKKYPSRVASAVGRKGDYCSKGCHYVNVANLRGRTDIELAMAKALKSARIKYQEQVPMYGRWVVDFVIPSRKLVVLCDGKYWHNRPKVKAKDRGQTNYLRKCGWSVLRFTCEEIKKSMDDCLAQVLSHSPSSIGITSQTHCGWRGGPIVSE